MNDNYAITLSKKSTIVIFLYYILLFILNLLLTTAIIIINNTNNFSNINIDNLTLIGSISISILSSSIYYIRKLYKLSLSEKINIPDKNRSLRTIGTIFYFLTRPIFAGVFAIVLVLGLKSGLFILTQSKSTSSLLELYMLISFFIGFSTGDFLNGLEKKSNQIITGLLKEKNHTN